LDEESSEAAAYEQIAALLPESALNRCSLSPAVACCLPLPTRILIPEKHYW
jgi:hypothetical protein